MKLTARPQNLVGDHCRPVLADDDPVPAQAVGGQETLVFDVSSQPGDEGLLLGAPGQPWTDPHGHQPFAAVLAGEKPLPESVTTVVRAADESAMAGEGVGHD
jgi:hypothetical protein